MKVDAMVLRFSKPSSSALTSPSAGTRHGAQAPLSTMGTPPSGPPASGLPGSVAVLPPRGVGWGGDRGAGGQEGVNVVRASPGPFLSPWGQGLPGSARKGLRPGMSGGWAGAGHGQG